ncbi:hypothetical protein ACWD8D_41865, partial [Streptomyces sp. NPDC005121]
MATPPTVPTPLSFHEERTLVAPWPVHDPTVVDTPAAPPGPAAVPRKEAVARQFGATHFLPSADGVREILQTGADHA